MHLSRLAALSGTDLSLHNLQEAYQVVTALGLEPLRLLTPFWFFACLRDWRVYAPDAHVLFRVSAALVHTQPPLWRPQQPTQLGALMPHRQRVLLLGFTSRLRRVRRPRNFAYGILSSDSEEERRDGDRPETAGHALAAHDREMAVACVEALGGSCLSAYSVLKLVEKRSPVNPAARDEADAASYSSESIGVDVVIVGQLARLRKAGVAFLDKGASHYEAGTQQSMASTQQKKKRLGARAEAALLYKLQELGIPCVHHQWLLDSYCFVSRHLQGAVRSPLVVAFHVFSFIDVSSLQMLTYFIVTGAVCPDSVWVAEHLACFAFLHLFWGFCDVGACTTV